MILGIIVMLVLIITLLTVYNMSIHKKIQSFQSLNQKVMSLNVLQDFMDAVSDCSSVDDKIRKINDVLIERYQVKYSTIVMYNGSEYIVKASNVDKRHWEVLRSLQTEEIFKDSIRTAMPKYVTVNSENERLSYQKMEFGRAKSALFFPLYIENVYVGYWIIEDSNPHEFDNMDTTILEVVKNNIIAVLKTVANQSVIENIVRDDKFSSLKTVEYLYGKGKSIIEQYSSSTVCLFKITNLEKINEEVSRKTGNEVITEVCEIVKSNLSAEYIFVRYMGPKFAIVFSGIELEAVKKFLEDIKMQVENIKIKPVDVEFEDDYAEDEDVVVTPKINAIISTYYKGTALEGLMKKMEEYLDNAKQEENSISYL